MAHVEREVKLVPDEPRLLDDLWACERLGPFRAARRRRERQVNTLFDTAGSTLRQGGVAFRRREVEGARLATFTVKGEGSLEGGLSERPEVEVWLAADTAPALALHVLQRVARERRAVGLVARLEDVRRAMRELPLHILVTFTTDRRLVDLEAPETGWRVELALDMVSLPGREDFRDYEVEVELRRGGLEALEAARTAIAALGPVRPATATKTGRIVAFLARAAPPAPPLPS